MKHRNVIVVILVIVAISLWALKGKKPVLVHSPASNLASMTLAKGASITPATASPFQSFAFVQMPGGPFEPRDPRWQWWNASMKRDPAFQWRMPISFYGKVVDEQNNPVKAALVRIEGTDLSPKGSFTQIRVSDENGLFSLEGKTGKFLSVDVRKDGYYTSQAENKTGFEYAAFSDPNYYNPNSNNPVIFHLRKKGKIAPLASNEEKVVVTFGSPSNLSMPASVGVVSPINITIIENDAGRKTWKARISVEGGGIQPVLQEFPFEAPANGYQSTMEIDQDSPHSPSWREIGEGGLFYFKTTAGYGLLKLQQFNGKKTLHYSILLNTQGGTNLEPAQ